jgi:hypothetical protein
MARVGRKPFRLKHLKRLAASPLAKARLEWLLKSLSGECTVPDACAALGINESRFHKLRGDWLQAAAACLEPGRAGRRPKAVSPEAQEVAALQDKLRAVEVELHASQVRAELAQALPQVVGVGRGGKKAGAKRPRPRNRARRGRGRR